MSNKQSVNKNTIDSKPKNTKIKKPFYKKWWFILLCIFFIIRAITSSGDKAKTAEAESTIANVSTSSETNPTDVSTNDSEEIQQQETKSNTSVPSSNDELSKDTESAGEESITSDDLKEAERILAESEPKKQELLKYFEQKIPFEYTTNKYFEIDITTFGVNEFSVLFNNMEMNSDDNEHIRQTIKNLCNSFSDADAVVFGYSFLILNDGAPHSYIKFSVEQNAYSQIIDGEDIEFN